MAKLKVWDGSAWEQIPSPGEVESAVESSPLVQSIGTEASVLAALRFDPEHPNYGAIRGDAEPDAATKAANRAAIQLAADDAFAAKGTLVLKGTYWIDGTVTFRCHVDGAGGEILVSDTTINPVVAVGVPGVNTSARKIDLPRIIQRGKPAGGGWGSSNDVGLRISNTNQCKIYIPYVGYFRTNLELYSSGGGHAYNEYSIGILSTGRNNLNFKTGAGGWVNENLLIGGRFHHDSIEGTNISGVRHIRIPVSESGHPFNNNYFLKPSIEGETPEYHVEAGGMYNTIAQGRWEANPPKVLWGDDANGWVIEGGYSAHTIQFTGTASNTRIRTRQNETWRAGAGAAGVLRLGNASSDGMPVLTVLPGGSTFWTRDPTTDYYISIAGTAMKFKNFSDAHPRLEIQSATGNLVFGSGSVAPSYRLEVNQFGNMIWRGGALFVEGAIVPSNGTQSTARIYAGADDPNGTQAASPGSLYLRTNGTIYRKGTGTGNTGWVEMS